MYILLITKNKQLNFNEEIHRPNLYNKYPKDGEAKSLYFQRIKLQPNQYTFQFKAKIKKTDTKNVDLMLKIGSVSECSFKEVVEESKNWWQLLKNYICNY